MPPKGKYLRPLRHKGRRGPCGPGFRNSPATTTSSKDTDVCVYSIGHSHLPVHTKTHSHQFQASTTTSSLGIIFTRGRGALGVSFPPPFLLHIHPSIHYTSSITFVTSRLTRTLSTHHPTHTLISHTTHTHNAYTTHRYNHHGSNTRQTCGGEEKAQVHQGQGHLQNELHPSPLPDGERDEKGHEGYRCQLHDPQPSPAPAADYLA